MEDEIRSDVVNEINEGSAEKHSWIVEIKELSNKESIPKEKKQAKESKNTIYKLPATIRRNFDRHDYEPYKVSFGPYHHNHDSCKQTQQIKKHVVIHTLRRTNKTIDDYVKALREVVQDLKDAYDELDPKWQRDDDDFLQLMVCDGCFLLEIVNEERDWVKAMCRRVKNNDYDYVNPVWNIDRISPRELMEYYRHDVLLLENQIPMLVLEKLVAVQMDKSIEEAREYLQRDILEFVYPSVQKVPRTSKCLHVLDLYRSLLSQELRAISSSRISLEEVSYRCRRISFLFFPLIIVFVLVLLIFRLIKFLKGRLFQTQLPPDFRFSIPSATELDNVGIGFTISKTKCLRDISFGHRNLGLPQISVDGATKSKFLNLIAFEHLHMDTKSKVISSYICFMARLLQSADDVRLLKSRGIIDSPLLNNEVAALFNGLTKGMVCDPDFDFKYYYVIIRLTESFYYKMNNPWKKDISQNYLRSPLAIVSLIAAFFLFCLTTIQTVYTVLSYYNNK